MTLDPPGGGGVSEAVPGRRQAVWNNTGDIAILRDPDGVERARAVCVPAPKPAKLPRKRR